MWRSLHPMMGFFTDRKEYKKLQTRVIGNGRYHLEKRLGQGGFGTTWLAADQENQQKVVVKELCPPQGEKREKEIRNFLREARVMASLHAVKEIVKVLNYFEEQGNAYIVMEYLRVTSLRHYLECQEEPLSFEKARDMLLPVMEGLEKMHGKHILHRDLTPDNLMLREDGSLCIIDFGSAREITEDDHTKTVLFKEGYAPPEQYEKHGKQKAWTDVYSLCAVCYEMITGAIPESSLSRREKDTLYPPSMYGAEITLEQEKVLLKGMALDYRERYSSVRELREAFLGKDEQESPEAEKKKGQAFRKFVPLLLGTVIVGVAGTGILWAGRTEPKVQYAGNFYRGSREAQELLTLTRTKAASSETSEDGTDSIFHLSEETVRAYGLPCNRFRFVRTGEELDAYLTQQKLSYTKQETETDCTVTVGEYDLIETDFHKITKYQVADTCTLMVEEDLNNGDILDFYMKCQRDQGIEPGEMAAEFLLFLTDAEDPEKKTAKDLTADDKDIMQQGKDDGMIYMYQWEEGMLIFKESQKDSLTVRIIPRKLLEMSQEKAYWPD